MYTKEIDNKKDLYRSPSVRVIAVSGDTLICTSPGGTEVYGLNGQSLTEDDFE